MSLTEPVFNPSFSFWGNAYSQSQRAIECDDIVDNICIKTQQNEIILISRRTVYIVYNEQYPRR